MPKPNFLNAKCPECGKGNRLQIEARTWWNLMRDGSVEMDEESMDGVWKPKGEDGAYCIRCEWKGVINDLKFD